MESISVSTRGGAQRLADGLEHESPTLLDRLSAASLRINESLDFDTVLQGVIDSARSLANARYGVLIAFDQSGGIENLITSGITPEERPRSAHMLPSCVSTIPLQIAWRHEPLAPFSSILWVDVRGPRDGVRDKGACRRDHARVQFHRRRSG